MNSAAANQTAPRTPAGTDIAWHLLDPQAAMSKLQTTVAGLREEEAAQRLRMSGPNALPEKKRPGLAVIFLHQFASPLIYILLGAGTVSLFIGEHSDALFIFTVILLNAALGTLQEWKAEKSAGALQVILCIIARVRRDGRDQQLPAEQLVPGDIVLLEAGNRVPADLRLLHCRHLTIDESLLTGESQAVAKDIATLTGSPSVAERGNLAFAGSTVASGRGTGVVIATGLNTEIGQIARVVAATSGTKTPLVIRMERFARQISFAVLGFTVLLAAVSLSRGVPYLEIFFIAVALAVSAIPEGLPVAMTVALSIASTRMARRGVIVRKLTAVEALGSCTCIASDKTGTLTVNRQTARLVGLPDGSLFDVTGEGYAGIGMLLNQDGTAPQPAALAALQRLALAGTLCNEGYLAATAQGWESRGDAVDIALLALACKVGLNPADIIAARSTLGEIVFEPERRYAAVAYRYAGSGGVAVKGAVEALLPFCATMQNGDTDLPLAVPAIEQQAIALAAGGYRVIAVAGTTETPLADLDESNLPPLTFLGIIGLIDPLRPEVKDAVMRCRQAGVQVVMITGDHPATALSIATELQIATNRGQLVTGAELDAIGSPQLPQYLEKVRMATVFSRVSPLQKLAIVDALCRIGHFVAVTGDGVNDAPALRRAHIGVAMGSGTDVAKDTAAIIISDDNFASIEGGLEEGRFAYDNIRKVVYLLISTGGAEIILFMLTLIAGLPLPLLAVQLLWLNLVTNGIQDVALAFEAGEPESIRRPPRPPTEGIFNRRMIEQVVISAATMGLIAFANWAWLLSLGWSEEAARNSTLLLMVLLENVHAFNCRSERRSVFRVSLRHNRLLVGGVILAQAVHIISLHHPLMQHVLGVQPVPLEHWLSLALMALALVAVMEIYKMVRRR